MNGTSQARPDQGLDMVYWLCFYRVGPSFKCSQHGSNLHLYWSNRVSVDVIDGGGGSRNKLGDFLSHCVSPKALGDVGWNDWRLGKGKGKTGVTVAEGEKWNSFNFLTDQCVQCHDALSIFW